jgi:hypothetical protein
MQSVDGCRVSIAPLTTVAPEDWKRLLATNPSASAFSDRAIHDAWWTAYGSGATDESLAVHNSASQLCGYLPIMRRPDGVRYFGATYHSDYATILLDLAPGGCAQAAADALASALLADASALDLRRLRPADPTHALLINALQRASAHVHRLATTSVEEPAPAIDLIGIETLDGHLERIDKKDRHEIRRKVRRGEAAGVVIRESSDLLGDLPEFIRLHRARWGERGLFTETPKGEAEVAFMRAFFATKPRDRVTLLFAASPEFGTFAAGLFLHDASAVRYWNAGGDAAARSLSPGVLLFVAGLQRAIDARVTTFDFLRGNEPYKYECGAQDVSVMQVTVPAVGTPA